MEMLLLVTETSFGLLLGRLLVSTEMYCKKWIHLPIQETKEIEHTALNYVPSKNNEIKMHYVSSICNNNFGTWIIHFVYGPICMRTIKNNPPKCRNCLNYLLKTIYLV